MTAYLASLTGYERTGVAPTPTLERIEALLAALGDPHRAFRSIHVTGTNGKGSVSLMASALLVEHGLSVGTFTSPHLSAVGERIVLEGHAATDAEMTAASEAVADAARSTGVTPSWFEAVTASGFWLFADRNVDTAVVEVGMLGRWDATNVLRSDVAVVTNIGLDHTDVAGPTRSDIATEKAGIIRAGASLVLGETDPRLRHIFENADPGRISTAGRDIHWSDRARLRFGSVFDISTARKVHRDVVTRIPGTHHCDNAVLAVEAVEEFLDDCLDSGTVRRSLGQVRLPGRCEVVRESPLVVLDGAHNGPGLAALRAATHELCGPAGLSSPAGPSVLVYGTLRGRDLLGHVASFAREFDVVIATEPPNFRAVPADALAAALGQLGQVCAVVPDPARAVEAAMAAAGPRGAVIVTGSLYLVGPARIGLTKASS